MFNFENNDECLEYDCCHPDDEVGKTAKALKLVKAFEFEECEALVLQQSDAKSRKADGS